MSSTASLRSRLGVAAAAALLAAFVLSRMIPLLQCADSCFVDYFAIHDAQTAHFESPDARLNTWILGWVHHAFVSQPLALFDSNAFYPAGNGLSSSEHLLGVALQTLPFGVFSDNPVLLHQAALVLSFLVLSLTTFALVRGLFGSTWGALLAGAAAAFMPWRFSELGHLQLLSVQFLPLVWLLTARVLESDRTRPYALWLSLTLGIQMLSSFYLAYLAVFSTAVLALVLMASIRPPGRALLRFGTATVVPAAITALTAIPYLSRFSGYRFREASATNFFTDPSVTLALLTPPFALRADPASIAPLTYHAPIALLIGGALALGWWMPGRNKSGAPQRVRSYTLAFVLMSIGAFILMLGRQILVGDTLFTLPAHWLAQTLPGFSQMRAEFRWGIVLGITVPVLAGGGIAWLEHCAQLLSGRRARAWAILITRVGTALFLATNVVWFELPARDAWAEARDVRAAHRALATLAAGPVAEIPWRLHPINTATNGSRYMLASSEHWRPLLNGYSAYVPATHHFLQRIARGLPAPQTVEMLNRLTGLRWIIVHPERLDPIDRQRWNELGPEDPISLAVSEPGFRIYEVRSTPASGSFMQALLAPNPGPKTMTGLLRAPVTASEQPGRIAVDLPAKMQFEPERGLPDFADVSFYNPSEHTWPGLDIHAEGLVLLRYRFFDLQGVLVYEGTASLDRDLPGGQTSRARALIQPPTEAGRFRVALDVVQQWEGSLHDLGFPTVAGTVSVSERRRLPGR